MSNTAKYFVMVGKGKHPIKPIARGPDFKGNWRDGALITTPVPQPLVYLLNDKYDGQPKPMYYEESIPVMRDDVAQLLLDAGVDNIQFFDAVLKDQKAGRDYPNYKAYNIVGLVSCADMAASTMMGTSSSTMGDADFEGLVLDESRTRGALLFRLAENVSAIVVHERIKAAVENSGIKGFLFCGPGEWSG